MVGGKLDRSTSTCLVPGGTLLIHRSSFNSMFKTGTDKLLKNKRQNQILHRVNLLMECETMYTIIQYSLLNTVKYYSVLNITGMFIQHLRSGM